MKVHIREVNLHLVMPPVKPLLSDTSAQVLAAIMQRASNPVTSGESVQPAARPTAPALGELWPEQGGIYAGVLRHAHGRHYHLIVATAEAGEHEGVAWGTRGDDITGASSKADGFANTAAMVEAGSSLGKWAAGLDIGAHHDWYIPSQRELALAWINAPDSFKTEGWYWSSTQYSRYGAWAQGFAGGFQSSSIKGNEFRARAVRRSFIE